MRCVYFTKPKRISEQFLEHMLECGDEVLAVVLDDPARWEGSGLLRMCEAESIRVIGYADCGGFFAEAEGLDALWCQTFPKLIKAEWCERARVCAVNFHAAPLPEYRGAFAYNFAILNGDASFGVTAHHIAPGLDEGDIVEVDRFAYDCAHGTVAELVEFSCEHQLAQFKRVRAMAESGFVPAEPQDGSRARYFSRAMFREAKRILPTDGAAMVECRIRAFWYPPYEGAYVELGGERFYPVTKEIIDGLAK